MKNVQSANQTETNTNPNVSMSFEEIALELNITVKEAKDAYDSAIKKMKHPRVGKGIKKYLGL